MIRFLISATDLKDNGFIHGNVEDKVLSVLIHRVQHNTIRPILGGVLYKKLLDDVEAYNNGNSPSTPIPANYDTLLNDYVVPCLIPYVEMRATTHLNWKIRNKSVGTANDEHIRSSNRQETKDLVNELETDAIERRNELIKYLCDNTDLFPEYLECNNVDVKPEGMDSSAGDNFLFVFGGVKSYDNERGRKPGER